MLLKILMFRVSIPTFNCQAQFQFSPMPVKLRLALSLIIAIHPTPPTPPGKVDIQLEINNVWPVDNW